MLEFDQKNLYLLLNHFHQYNLYLMIMVVENELYLNDDQ